MKATLNGKFYDTEAAEYIINNPAPAGDDLLYRTDDGEFFLVQATTFFDGRKLKPWESPITLAPELKDFGAVAERDRRTRQEHEIVLLTNREAMIWCVKACVPECFRGCILESI